MMTICHSEVVRAPRLTSSNSWIKKIVPNNCQPFLGEKMTFREVKQTQTKIDLPSFWKVVLMSSITIKWKWYLVGFSRYRDSTDFGLVKFQYYCFKMRAILYSRIGSSGVGGWASITITLMWGLKKDMHLGPFQIPFSLFMEWTYWVGIVNSLFWVVGP